MTARHFLGIGHESRAQFADLLALIELGLAQAGLQAGDIAGIASLAGKEPGGLVAELGRHFAAPVRYFSAAALEVETPRLKNPSEAIFRQMGCHGVAEAAALAAAGPAAHLILPKMAGRGGTCAIARRGPFGR
ncbi:cobalamin biosynthesis protein [Dongia sp.]|uniref:cobalamin biosynthesis protein n=1 Tax=Dongia sp. TaxID=1977262 RepID=UPI0035B253E5